MTAPEPEPPRPPAAEGEVQPGPMHLAQVAAIPFRAWIAFPAPPDAAGRPTDEMIECYLVRGLDTVGLMYHAFGPPGRPLPPHFKAVLTDHDGLPLAEHPVGVHIEFEVEEGPGGYMVFSEPHQLARTNN